MNARDVKTMLVVVVLVCTAVGGLVFGVKKFRDRVVARRQAELQKEQEENRLEAAVAFNDPVAPSAEEAAEFTKVLARFSDAIRDENGSALADLFDAERLYDELLRQGGENAVLRNTSAARSQFAAGFRTGAKNTVFNPLLQWDTTTVRRIRWSADRSEAVVVASHRRALKVGDEEFPLTLKMRWWFVRRSGAWRMYDIEDLDGGLRITALLSALASPEFLPKLPELKNAVAGFQDAQAALLQGDPDGIDEGLARCRRVELPPKVEAAVALLEAAAKIARADGAGALERIDAAERLNPDMPVRHALRATCLNLTGDHEAALAEAEAYVALLGPDENIDVQRGVALEGFNRRPEAAAAYRRALDDVPWSQDAFDGLRRTLTGDRGELADRLAKAPDPGKLFEALARKAREDKDTAAVEVLERGLARALPNDPRGITGNIRRLVGAKKYAEAAEALRDGLGRVTAASDREDVLDAYLFAMVAAGKPLEAYAAVPEAHARDAFRTLASELEDSLEDVDLENLAGAAKQLHDLTEAHGKRSASDPWLVFYEGVLFQAGKDYEKAEKAFAAAHAAYLEANPGGAESNTFRSRRVRCLILMKQGLRAYAEVGPAADTFAQVAQSYRFDKDAAGLEALVAAHRKRYPADVQLLYWSAEVLLLKDEGVKAADGFRMFLRRANAKEANRSAAAEWCVRGYLRANKLREARDVVADFGPVLVGAGLRAAVALADERPEQAEAILAQLAKERGGFGFVYYDEDFARQILRPEYAELRKKYPDPRPPKPPGPPG